MVYPSGLTNTYEIYEEIGAGGGGTVYRAVHKRLQKTVVLKKLKGTVVNIMDCRTEVDVLKNLRHSYLPQVLDFIESSDGVYTVMDFIPGKSLQQMMDEGHRFTEKEVLKYTKQLCEALQYLHVQNPPIIHGDIKPDNIMITPEGNVCLIDFNISGVLEDKAAVTYGYTPGFSAPEQAEAFERIRTQMRQQVLQKEDQKKSVSQEKETVALNSFEEETALLSTEEDKTTFLNQTSDETVLIGLDENTILQENNTRGGFSEIHTKQPGISIDKRSDIYSVGATMYTLLTGSKRNSKDKKLVIENVSNGFLVVLAKALAYSPDKRYPDAGKMLQAVISVHKKDKKYRRLLCRQAITIVLLFLMTGVSALCVVEGKRKMEQERADRYEELVVSLLEATEKGGAENTFEELYNEAVLLFPAYLDAYYAKAYYLYQMQGIEATTTFIEEILDIPVEENKEIRSNLYHLHAECYFQKEQYEKAEFYYNRAIADDSSNVEIYRDYAITLAYLGKEQEAEEILWKAASLGLARTDILMVQGELARNNGRNEEAIEFFFGVLEETEDDYMRQRAYIMMSKAYAAIGTKEALQKDADLLSNAVRELEIDSRVLIYERLIQDYITLGEISKDYGYYEQAIEVLEEIVAMNWGTQQTYSNAIILCLRMGKPDDATLWAGQMLQKYPEHYITYVRLCYLEVEKQNEKENEERSYEMFAEYYEKAMECYKKQMSGNVTNAEMLQLEQIYKDIVKGNWLK